MSNHTITIAGKDYRMEFNLYALMEFERSTGKNTLMGIQEFNTRDSLELTRCGIKGANPDFDMTIEEIGKHMKAQNLNTVMIAFAEDQGADLEQKEKDEEDQEAGEN